MKPGKAAGLFKHAEKAGSKVHAHAKEDMLSLTFLLIASKNNTWQEKYARLEKNADFGL